MNWRKRASLKAQKGSKTQEAEAQPEWVKHLVTTITSTSMLLWRDLKPLLLLLFRSDQLWLKAAAKLMVPLALAVISTLCAGPYVWVPVAQGLPAPCPDGTALSHTATAPDQPPKQTPSTVCSVPGMGEMGDVHTWEQLSAGTNCRNCRGFSFGEMCT